MRASIHPKKRKRNISIFIPLFIVLVMVLSLFSIIDRNNSQNKTKYKNYNFVQNVEERTWELEKDDRRYIFHYLPTELFVKVINLSLTQQSYYLIEDPSANYSLNDLSLIGLAKFEAQESLNKNGVSTAIGFSTEYNSIAPITCQNASEQIGVILFQLGNETRIVNENNCIFVEGNSGIEVIKAKDKLMYIILEIE